MVVEYFNYKCPTTGVLRACSIDGKWKKNLDLINLELRKKDRDKFLIITGEEGSGKTVFGMITCSYKDPTFNLSRVCMNGEEFKNAVMKDRKSVV